MIQSKQGQIILLNGVSSSGKSTILRAIHTLDADIKILKVDDWFPAVLHKKAESLGWHKEMNIDPWIYLYNYVHEKTGKYYFNTQVRAMLFNEATDFYQKAKEIAAAGHTVIIDTVLEYEKEFETFQEFFKDYPVLKVLVYCPMNVLLERVESRNKSGVADEYRTAFQSFEQFPAIFKLQEHDTEMAVEVVQSSVLTKTLDKSIEDLMVHNPPAPYVLKFQEFKHDFIKLFKLNEKDEITLAAKHLYDLVLNSSKKSSTELAQEIIDLINNKKDL